MTSETNQSQHTDLCHIYEGTKYVPLVTPEVLDDIKKFRLRTEDVIIAAYPRSGITWLGEIVWLVNNKADVSLAEKTVCTQRTPFLEFPRPFLGGSILEDLENMPSPRIIKTHLDPSFIEQQIQKNKAKVIYLLRNPKDVLVSYYHFYRMNSFLGAYTGSWDSFYVKYKGKNVSYGDWFVHVKKWLSIANTLVVSYEDLQKSISDEVLRIAGYLGQSLSEDELFRIKQYIQFEEMKLNPKTNFSWIPRNMFKQEISHYFRKGQIGDWQNYFSEMQNDEIDAKLVQLMQVSPQHQRVVEKLMARSTTAKVLHQDACYPNKHNTNI